MFNTSMIKKNCKPVGSGVGAWVGSGIGAWVGFGTEIFSSKMTPKHYEIVSNASYFWNAYTY